MRRLLPFFREVFGCRPHMADSSGFLLLSFSQEKMDSEIDFFHFVFLIIFYLFNTGNTVHPVTFIKGKGEKA